MPAVAVRAESVRRDPAPHGFGAGHGQIVDAYGLPLGNRGQQRPEDIHGDRALGRGQMQHLGHRFQEAILKEHVPEHLVW